MKPDRKQLIKEGKLCQNKFLSGRNKNCKNGKEPKKKWKHSQPWRSSFRGLEGEENDYVSEKNESDFQLEYDIGKWNEIR